MLRDGKFFREEPPRIGAHYFPVTQHKDFTEEEWRTQRLLLGDKDEKASYTGEILIWIAVLFAVADLLYLAFKGL
jgi:hypothetical protein